MFKLFDRNKLTMSAMVLLLLSAIIISACNTVEGAGRDISATGDAISNTADDVSDEIAK